MKVIYQQKVWEVVTPKDLKFPPKYIRNVLIKRGNKTIITNTSEIESMDQFKSMDEFLK